MLRNISKKKFEEKTWKTVTQKKYKKVQNLLKHRWIFFITPYSIEICLFLSCAIYCTSIKMKSPFLMQGFLSYTIPSFYMKLPATISSRLFPPIFCTRTSSAEEHSRKQNFLLFCGHVETFLPFAWWPERLCCFSLSSQ